MIEGLKPYPAMKDSGVAWLGEVPEHWEVRRLRNLADMRVSNVDKHTKEGEQPVRLCNYVDVYKHDYIRPSMCVMQATATRDEVDRFRLAVGDVLITKDSEAWDDIGVPALVRETAPDLVSGYHLAILRPLKQCLSGDYLLSVLQSTPAQYQFHVEANGVTRYGLSHAAIKSIWLPTSPLPEQAAIVRFLDHADRRIRRYIGAKQKLIKLLEEQKRAIIHRAVTRGLDPNVRLKPSGVEWLGDVPEHWETVRSKRLFIPRTELAMPGDVQLSATQAYGVISQEEYERRVGRKIVKIIRHLEKRRHVEIDDFVISMRSFQGGLERAWERGCIRSSYVVLRPTRNLCVPYFARLFKSPAYIGAIQATANFIRDGQDLNYGNFCAVDLPWPPLAEQARIAEAVDEALATSLIAGERAAQEIDLLREYRTRLIADVVTGKLDVREAAARLPDEFEEPEPIDEIEAEGDTDEAGAGNTDDVPEEAED